MKIKSMEFESQRQAEIGRYSIRAKTSKIYKKKYPNGEIRYYFFMELS